MSCDFPDKPCIKRVYRDKGIGPLISSQERRAAVVPLTNRLSNADFSSIGLHRISLVRASEETFRTCVPNALDGTRDSCFLGGPIRRRPVLPGSVPPRRPAVGRPDPTCSGMSGFWIREV